MGDPLYDIAEFIASLQYLEFSKGLLLDELTRAGDLFFESYQAQVPWSCNRRRLTWYVLAFLIIKIYSAVKNLDIQALSRLDLSAEEFLNSWLNLLDG